MQATNLIEVLEEKGLLSHIGITFIESSHQEEFLSYRELYRAALQALSYLQDAGMEPGDELVFQLSTNKVFVITFWACILGGIIPVPLSVGLNDGHTSKLFNVWRLLRRPYLISAVDTLHKIGGFAARHGLSQEVEKIKHTWVDEAGVLVADRQGVTYAVAEDDIAFVQFSSGSTGAPKGVVLTHRNLIANVGAIAKAAAYSTGDTTLSWMPLTHDMGLIGFHINPLFSEMNQLLMPTQVFIRRPAIWMEKASVHSVSILCSPNFGFDYFTRHCDFAGKKYEWDLSAIRLIYNGAEPVSEKICRHFTAALANYGLSAFVMRPVYGLAEASLAVSISRLGDDVQSVYANRHRVSIGDKIAIAEKEEDAVPIVNVGQPVDHCSVRIQDNDDRAVVAGVVGHVQIKGPNVTSAYYNNVGETEKSRTADGWWKTGDLGFMMNGCLYITGRAKDIIFRNGQNYYPHDLEIIAGELEGIELNKVVVTGYFNPASGRDEIVVFLLHREHISKFSAIAGRLRAHISDKAGLDADHIVPVKEIPRTTSGKLQRFRLLEQYRAGEIGLGMTDVSSVEKQEGPVPEDPAARQLLKVASATLQHADIKLDDDFFAAGGNSLKAAELSMKIEKTLGVSVSLETIYEARSLRKLLEVIIHTDSGAYCPIPAARQMDVYPLTAAQKRIYYAWEMNRAGTAYNLPVVFSWKGKLDLQRLEDCLHALIRRHDVLRSNFFVAKEVTYRIGRAFSFSLDCRPCVPLEVNDVLKSLVKPFDLNGDLLFRSSVLTVGEEDYVLFMDFHHIIADGVAVFHFMQELIQLYNGKELAALKVQYTDYTVWENTWMASDAMKQQRIFWEQQLQGDLPVLDLLTDFQRPAFFNTEGARFVFNIPLPVAGKLKSLADRHQCSLHAVFFALYNLLLSLYTGRDEQLVGIPVAGRRHPDLQEMQGMFVNNLAIISRVNHEESFSQLLQRTQQQLLTALTNQDYPFNELEVLNRRGDVSRNLVFDTMFLYHNMGLPVNEAAEFSISRRTFDPGSSKFDLSMEIFEENGILEGGFEYATALFGRRTIARLAASFIHLMEMVPDHESVPLSRLQMISDETWHQYIYTFNDTKTPYPADKGLHILFEEQVMRKPLHPAIVSSAGRITYEGVNNKANRLAMQLKTQGFLPGDIAAVFLDRSPELVIAMLAILKAGGCFLPLEPDFPKERIHTLVRDSACKYIVTGDYQDKLKEVGAIITDMNAGEPDDRTFANPAPVISADAPAYVIYTSGTTGVPKGVVISHRSIVNYISWAAGVYVKNSKADFPFYTSVASDLTLTSIFLPLATGNSIVIYQDNREALAIEQIIADNTLDIVKLTPAHLNILVNNRLPVSRTGDTGVRALIVGGEKLETALAAGAYEMFSGGITIYNEYGPTEATVGCMIHTADPAADTGSSVPIGIPAANTQIYVLDRLLRPVPAGVKGELYISGEGLAIGYLFREELTAERFIPNPFVPGARMYKTGDLARHLPEGYIEYIGRNDQQVKINGYRVELAEIEHQLSAFEHIQQAVVTLSSDSSLLHAYYVSDIPAGDTIAPQLLRNYLIEKLPYYMIPVYFTRIAALPLTRSGKMDYAALAMAGDDSQENTTPQVASDPMEEMIIAVCGKILGTDGLHKYSNFLGLGGDSIKAVQVSFRLSVLGILLKPRDILIYQTIEQMALHAIYQETSPVYDQGIQEGVVGLSPVKSWFFNRKYVNEGFYNQSVLLHLNRKVDTNLLRDAFDRLIAHHDGLRINRHHQAEELFYNNDHLKSPFELPVAVVDSLVGFPFYTFKNSFSINADLLIRAALIRLPGDDEYLLITAHHLIIDGVSWRVLLEDLYTGYVLSEKGEEVRLPAKTASLADWQQALCAYIPDGAVLDFWHAANKIKFVLPLDMPASDWSYAHQRKITNSIDRELTLFLLKDAHTVYKTDVPILLNLSLALALKEWTGQAVLVIEQETHGRHLEAVDTSRTISWFTNMYPLVLEPGDGTLSDQIKAVKEQARKVPANGMGYGIMKYVHRSFTEEVPGQQEVRLNYLGQFNEEMNNDLFTYSHADHGPESDFRNQMNVKLEFNLMVIGERLHMEVCYNCLAHTAATVKGVSDAMLKYLQDVLAHVRLQDGIHFTPSDFNLTGLDQEEFNTLFH
nr:non-ribosomal peptide synthetase [uncultured Chitinophaga sp.]